MANRYRANFLYGVLSGFNNSQTTFTGTGFPSSIPTGYYLPIIINPGYNGSATASGEVVYAINITGGNVITVSGRGFEGTTAITGTNGTAWLAGPLVSDFDVSNLTSSGTLTLSGTGGLTVSGAAAFNGGVTASTVTVTGGLTVSGSLTTNGGLTVSGAVSLPNSSVALSAINPLPAAVSFSGIATVGATTSNTTPLFTNAATVSGHTAYLITFSFDQNQAAPAANTTMTVNITNSGANILTGVNAGVFGTATPIYSRLSGSCVITGLTASSAYSINIVPIASTGTLSVSRATATIVGLI